MNNERLQSILAEDISLLMGLRDRLDDKGEPLSPTDKQILREQLSGIWLRAMQEEQRYLFAKGNIHDVSKGFDEIHEVMKQLQ